MEASARVGAAAPPPVGGERERERRGRNHKTISDHSFLPILVLVLAPPSSFLVHSSSKRRERVEFLKKRKLSNIKLLLLALLLRNVQVYKRDLMPLNFNLDARVGRIPSTPNQLNYSWEIHILITLGVLIRIHVELAHPLDLRSDVPEMFVFASIFSSLSSRSIYTDSKVQRCWRWWEAEAWHESCDRENYFYRFSFHLEESSQEACLCWLWTRTRMREELETSSTAAREK